MFNSFRNAYKTGWRAGFAGSGEDICPYKRKRDCIVAALWLLGWEDGLHQSIKNWLADREASRHAKNQ